MKMQGPLFKIQEIGAIKAPSTVYLYLCISLAIFPYVSISYLMSHSFGQGGQCRPFQVPGMYHSAHASIHSHTRSLYLKFPLPAATRPMA